MLNIKQKKLRLEILFNELKHNGIIIFCVENPLRRMRLVPLSAVRQGDTCC